MVSPDDLLQLAKDDLLKLLDELHARGCLRRDFYFPAGMYSGCVQKYTQLAAQMFNEQEADRFSDILWGEWDRYEKAKKENECQK